ncbi:MAG: hypothetical protein WAM04_03890 [Candidatus Sulfotelmatobacter sp.]
MKFVVKLTAFLALAGASSLMSAGQQTTPPVNSDSSAQIQPQGTNQTASPQQSSPQSAAPAQSSSQQSSSQQSSSQQPSSQQPSDKSKNAPNTSGKVEGTSNDRLFYTLPNFLTLQGKGQLPPMSVKDKYKVVALGTFDYVEYPWWAVLAALSQAFDGEPAFGQGWGAYAKRYGVTAGDSMVENFMVGAVFPSALHQDPRYYQSGQGGFLRRTEYSVSRIFVTRTDSGHKQFNYSEIFGAATAAAISTYSYHPSSTYVSTPNNPHEFVGSDKTLSNTIDTWGTQLGLDTITLVVKEFWPDIHRKMSHKHKSEVAPAVSTKP